MTVAVKPRAEWGSALSKITYVSPDKRTEFFVHYDGGVPVTRTGVAVPKAIEAGHLRRGWKGAGYNFIVEQDGTAYEARGWNGLGAHCPGHNTSGIGVQVAIGADQTPSDAALTTVRKLYDEACERSKRVLRKMGHRDGKATACPGAKLYAWVQLGMPYPKNTGGPVANPPARPPAASAPGVSPRPAPRPAPGKKLAPDRQLWLKNNGDLDSATIARWQQIMGTHIDGVISRPSNLVKAVQRHLIARGFSCGPSGADGKGIVQKNGYESDTIRALQRYLQTEVDGEMSSPKSGVVKALQNRLNEARF